MYNNDNVKEANPVPELRRLFEKLQNEANEAMLNSKTIKKHVNMFKPEMEKDNEKEEVAALGIIDQFDQEIGKLLSANRIQRENIERLNNILGS